MNASRIKNTLINTIFGVGSYLIITILNFVMRTVFIQTLGVQYNGVSGVFSDIFTMLSISELGIGTAIATALYKPLKENDRVQLQKYMQFYKNAYHYIAGFIFVVGIVITPFLNYIIKDVPDIQENLYVIFVLYLLKTISSYLMVYKCTLLNAAQKQYMVKRLEIVCSLIKYFIEIVQLLIFSNFILYLIIEIVSGIIQNLVVTRKAEKEYPDIFLESKERLSSMEKKKLLKDVKGLSMFKISGSIGNSIDNVLISSMINTTMVGYLSNYTMIRRQVETILMQFFSAVLPSVGNLVAEKDNEKQYVVFNRIYYISFLVICFCATSCAVLSQSFISMWLGASYILEKRISQIIAIDLFLYILLQAIASFRTANGMFVKGQYRPLVTAILNVLLSIFFIKLYGVLGAILATVVCRLATQWYDSFLLFKYVFCKPFHKFLIKYVWYIVVFVSDMFFTDIVINWISINNIILKFFFQVVVCVIFTNGYSALMTCFTKEFKYVMKISSKIITRKRRLQ